jgi:hypothetical protein
MLCRVMEVTRAFYTWAKKPEDTDKARQRKALRSRPGSFLMAISKFMAIGGYPMRCTQRVWRQGGHEIGVKPKCGI